MKKILLVSTLCGAIMAGNNAFAQEKCGLDIMTRELITQNPKLADVIEQYNQETVQKAEELKASLANTARKTSGIVSVPVVFHVILNQAQLDAIGGTTGVYSRVATQIEVLNNDYNAKNSDLSGVPSGFQPLIGDVGIYFWPAHRAPDGTATNGIEIRVAPSSTAGFDQSSSAVKRTAYGGLDPWDREKYLNIWIVNINDNGLLGYAYSPNYAKNIIGDANQTGVVVDYGAFGVKPISSSYYWHTSATKGRTLTHELGHFFNLWHVWGKSNVGSGTCSDEDGISDTPLQYDATQSCQTYPYKDVCTSTGNGIMFMNYMDYSGDGCTKMFSKGQTTVMQYEVSSSGDSYGLTIHPELFEYPTGTSSIEMNNHFDVFPNPSNGVFNINFTSAPNSLESITVINTMGQTVKSIIVTDKSQSHFSIDLSGYSKGMYMVQATFTEGNILRKVVLQ